MGKPIIFFSHSSKDKKSLIKLKELFVAKTNDTIDVFLSSDGQSIPLGRNWLMKIEDALNNSRIMFTFITPNSINSKWIYFEAGFAYSKGIRVIPVGLLSFDLNDLPAPLSILQGFNANSVDGLNNIIAIVNKEFDYKHELSFETKELSEIYSTDVFNTHNLLGEYWNIIDCINITVNSNEESNFEHSDITKEIMQLLDESETKFLYKDNSINIFGLEIKASNSQYPEYFKINLDPNSFNTNFDLLCKILNKIRKNNLRDLKLNIDIKPNYDKDDRDYKWTSKLINSEVKLDNSKSLVYKNLVFEINDYFYFHEKNVNDVRFYLGITNKSDKIEVEDIKELINLLVDKEVIFKN